MFVINKTLFAHYVFFTIFTISLLHKLHTHKNDFPLFIAPCESTVYQEYYTTLIEHSRPVYTTGSIAT